MKMGLLRKVLQPFRKKPKQEEILRSKIDKTVDSIKFMIDGIKHNVKMSKKHPESEELNVPEGTINAFDKLINDFEKLGASSMEEPNTRLKNYEAILGHLTKIQEELNKKRIQRKDVNGRICLPGSLGQFEPIDVVGARKNSLQPTSLRR